MATYETAEFRNGLKVEIDGVPYLMVYFQFVKPGKGTAFTRTKLKNMLTGAILERTYRTGERLQAADVEEKAMSFMYKDEAFLHFMDNESYEQVQIPVEKLQDELKYLTENLVVTVLFHKSRAMLINLPNFIESVINYCEPGVRGNTATGATKTARLECGAEVQVPLFIEQGEKIRVDTRTNEYVSRVKDT